MAPIIRRAFGFFGKKRGDLSIGPLSRTCIDEAGQLLERFGDRPLESPVLARQLHMIEEQNGRVRRNAEKARIHFAEQMAARRESFFLKLEKAGYGEFPPEISPPGLLKSLWVNLLHMYLSFFVGPASSNYLSRYESLKRKVENLKNVGI